MKVYIVAMTFLAKGNDPMTSINGVFNSRNDGLEKLIETYKIEVNSVKQNFGDDEMATFEEVDVSNIEGEEEIAMSFKTQHVFVTVKLIPQFID